MKKLKYNLELKTFFNGIFAGIALLSIILGSVATPQIISVDEENLNVDYLVEENDTLIDTNRIFCSTNDLKTTLFKDKPTLGGDVEAQNISFLSAATHLYRSPESIKDSNGVEYYEVFSSSVSSEPLGYIMIDEISDDYLIVQPKEKNAIDIRTLLPNVKIAENMSNNIPLLEKNTLSHLAEAEKQFEKDGYCLKIYSAYRSRQEQKELYKQIDDNRFVTSPDTSVSWHSVGRAVDVTLVNIDTGEELTMPTKVYDFSKRAARYNIAFLDKQIKDNIEFLTQVMNDAGFVEDSTQWWHFEYQGEGGYLPTNISNNDVEIVNLSSSTSVVSSEEARKIAEGKHSSEIGYKGMASSMTLVADTEYEIHKETMDYGDYGHLSIPKIDLEMPLYALEADNYDVYTAQAIVDRNESACIMFNNYNTLIADHSKQGFNKLYNITEGMDVIIYFPDGTKALYVCSEVDPNSTNIFDVMDSNGVTANDGPRCLWLYTCNVNSHGGDYITIVKCINQTQPI